MDFGLGHKRLPTLGIDKRLQFFWSGSCKLIFLAFIRWKEEVLRHLASGGLHLCCIAHIPAFSCDFLETVLLLKKRNKKVNCSVIFKIEANIIAQPESSKA